jgi:uncharacterized protein YukE
MSDDITEMQARWHRLRKAWEGEGFEPGTSAARMFHAHDTRLCNALWQQAHNAVAEDRRKHPKAKRNRSYVGPVGRGRTWP